MSFQFECRSSRMRVEQGCYQRKGPGRERLVATVFSRLAGCLLLQSENESESVGRKQNENENENENGNGNGNESEEFYGRCGCFGGTRK